LNEVQDAGPETFLFLVWGHCAAGAIVVQPSVHVRAAA